jgi:hypothetical protein
MGASGSSGTRPPPLNARLKSASASMDSEVSPSVAAPMEDAALTAIVTRTTTLVRLAAAIARMLNPEKPAPRRTLVNEMG